jgi:hypothetical protein
MPQLEKRTPPLNKKKEKKVRDIFNASTITISYTVNLVIADALMKPRTWCGFFRIEGGARFNQICHTALWMELRIVPASK